MLWEVELRPAGRDGERERVCDEFDLLTHSQRGADLVAASARGYLLEGELRPRTSSGCATSCWSIRWWSPARSARSGPALDGHPYTVLLKPGVMDPVSQSVRKAAARPGPVGRGGPHLPPVLRPRRRRPADRELLFRKVLANDAIEQVVVGRLHADHLAVGKPYTFQLVTVPLRDLDDAGLMKLSKDGQLALTLEEMRTIQAHFRDARPRPDRRANWRRSPRRGRNTARTRPSRGRSSTPRSIDGERRTRRYKNLLKETVFAATQTIRERLGADDWCVSVFADNAGVVKFDDDYHICFKVETHNRPSAIEPYGGANTGLGGVIRDVLGTGLGGRPICNTDVFCFARPDYPPEELPPGVLHPRRVIQGVVAGVRDYGNRMGIPTVNGAVVFDDRYLANPLVFCGTVGLIPVGMETQEGQSRRPDRRRRRADRAGRHPRGDVLLRGADRRSPRSVSGGAVQIGNAIEEKKVLDVVLAARDRGLFTAITDCGAGGFSSAVGEMGADTGADVHLENAPLKYEGLSYTEIWISESQERMVLAVPPEKWEELRALCAGEDVEAAVLGTFTDTGRLRTDRTAASRSPTWTCTSCTTAGRRWCARRIWDAASPRDRNGVGLRRSNLPQDVTARRSSPPTPSARKEWIDPPVRPRGAGRQRRQAARRRRRTTARPTRRWSCRCSGRGSGRRSGAG